MKVGSVDLYANHPMVIVGSEQHVDDATPLGGSAAVATESHVTIATRGQAALVRVSLWMHEGPRIGTIVFDGRVTLASHFLAVRDVEGISRFVAAVGGSGSHRLMVLVDDPGYASRVAVIVDGGDDVRSLTAVVRYPMFDVVRSDPELDPSDELALILGGHDLPLNRLAAALKVAAQTPGVRPAIRSFWTSLIVEWIRWLSPWLSFSESQAIGETIEERLAARADDSVDEWAAATAVEILNGIRF